jgi:hypothetical protein
MNFRIIFFGWILFIICSNSTFAQSPTIFPSEIHYKSDFSTLFGKDIKILDEPEKNQNYVVVTSAFNGWIYSAVAYDTIVGKNIKIMRSVDNGIHWEQLFLFTRAGIQHEIIPKLDIITSGNSLSNLKIIMGWVYKDTLYGGGSGACLGRLNGVKGQLEEDLLSPHGDYIYDFDLCSDENYPASATNPGSIAFLYSRMFWSDSICIRTSSNGGLSFDSYQIIACSNTGYFKKVALAYGRSSSYNSGQYYTVWEKQEYESSTAGHIYYAHSYPNYNSSFTAPFCLDSLDPSSINHCRNPLISCQYGESDNDTSNYVLATYVE